MSKTKVYCKFCYDDDECACNEWQRQGYDSYYDYLIDISDIPEDKYDLLKELGQRFHFTYGGGCHFLLIYDSEENVIHDPYYTTKKLISAIEKLHPKKYSKLEKRVIVNTIRDMFENDALRWEKENEKWEKENKKYLEWWSQDNE